MMTRIFLAYLVLAGSLQLFAQTNWEVVKTPVEVELRRVFYLDSMNVWAAGDSGTIIHSSDKGVSWVIQSSGLQKRIEDIFFLDESKGWAVTWTSDGVNFQSQILTTTNGGADWSSEDYRHSNILLSTIFFIDSLNGWMGGEPFDFSFTTDGGIEWYPANLDTGSFAYFPIHEVKFSTPQLGFAAGGVNDAVGVVWRTTNGGELWKAYGIGPDRFLDFIFLDSSKVLALSNEVEGAYPMGELKFDILTSTIDYSDGDSIYAIVYGISNRTTKEIWAALAQTSRDFLFSGDSAETWQFIPIPDSLRMFDIEFADSVHGIAVGENGYILKYIPQNSVDVDEYPGTNLPDEFKLEQNYPNPFNPTTTIKFTVGDAYYASPTRVLLRVYDVLGNEIAKLVDEQKSPGIYQVEFASSVLKNISSGIYFYRLQAGSFSQTKKMVLLK
ncbi:MAG: T9SS type A sorting domain-containing protein [Ignavibacteriales bacterium]|nr:MAG: T9SS type A sorting domain-containing protein [Ignavibacteriales bacterium]